MTSCRSFTPFALVFAVWTLGWVAGPSPAGADDEPGARDGTFFEAYYLQHAERRKDEALLLYLRYLGAEREGTYARQAARLAHGILTASRSDNLDAFLRLYGAYLEEPEPREAREAPSAPAPPPLPPRLPANEPEPRGVDGVLLDAYLEAAGRGARPAEVRSAESNLRQREALWRRGDFMEGLRRVTGAHRVVAVWRVAEMLQRKRGEVEDLRKQLSIQEGFGAAAEADALRAQIETLERVIALARDEEGIYEQIWKLYLPSRGAPVANGFLPLVRGIHRPEDPAYASWVPQARSWLKQQSMRRGSTDGAIADAVRASQVLQAIETHQREGNDAAARVAARGLWRSLTRVR